MKNIYVCEQWWCGVRTMARKMQSVIGLGGRWQDRSRHTIEFICSKNRVVKLELTPKFMVTCLRELLLLLLLLSVCCCCG